LTGFSQNPAAVAVGDFNNDGNLDFVVTYQATNTVKVALGATLGGFTFTGPFVIATISYGVAVGDFNSDGKVDVAAANSNSSTVSVLLGNGDGTFGAATNIPAGANPGQVAVGDFNSDGKLDVAAANPGSGVSILLGNGDGTFAAPVHFGPVASALGVAVGDFNRDGFPDVATAAYVQNGAVDVLLNQTPVTSTVLASNRTTAYPGQLTTFVATVTSASGTTPLTGSVLFKDGATTLGSGTLSLYYGNYVATVSTAALTPGYHNITAAYQGGPKLSPSISAPFNQLVAQTSTITTVTAAANPALAGQPLTLTATVTPTTGTYGPPTGSVQFYDGTVILGSASLSNGVATFTTAALSPGSHTLVGVYSGDNSFTVSTPPGLTLVINNPVPAVTALSPATLPEGSPAFTLTLSGSGFLRTSTVQWNGSNLTTIFLSATQIQAVVPATVLAEEGSALVKVSNPTPGGGSSLLATFVIADAPLTASGQVLNVLGNKSFNGTVATFTDGNAAAPLSDFTALITWDDGTATPGTVSGASGSYTVSGTHTFAAFANVHTVTVTIYDKGGKTATASDLVIDPAPAAVSDNPNSDPASVAGAVAETSPVLPLTHKVVPHRHTPVRHQHTPAKHHHTPAPHHQATPAAQHDKPAPHHHAAPAHSAHPHRHGST
jgi:hypothetical protein